MYTCGRRKSPPAEGPSVTVTTWGLHVTPACRGDGGWPSARQTQTQGVSTYAAGRGLPVHILCRADGGEPPAARAQSGHLLLELLPAAGQYRADRDAGVSEGISIQQ